MIASRGWESLHAVVLGVGHVDRTVRCDGNAAWMVELTDIRARVAPDVQQCPGRPVLPTTFCGVSAT